MNPKFVRSILPCFFCLAMLTRVVGAQQFAYGSPEDLLGTLWTFVYTGSQLSEREAIIKKLKKEIPYLRYAEDPRQADIVIIYGSAKSDVFAGNWGQAIGSGTTTCSAIGTMASCSSSGGASGYSIPMYLPVRSGRGLVFIRGRDGQLRLVLEHASDSRILEKDPRSKFIGRFIKEYKIHNPTPPPDRPPRDVLTDPKPVRSSSNTRASSTPADGPETMIFSGDYNVSISPHAKFRGRMELNFYREAVAGTLITNSGREASVAGTKNDQQLSISFRFLDSCTGNAQADATLDGEVLSGTYSASDCAGDYTGSFALILEK